MKNFLISIRPEHTMNILNGLKTIEVRTRVPKEWKDYLDKKTLEKPQPSKWYIYCTKGKILYKAVESNEYLEYASFEHWSNDDIKINGKVVAEFTLKEVEKIEQYIAHSIPTCVYITDTKRTDSMLENATCLTQDEIHNYLKGKTGYALYIDDLIIYDNPKELSEFKVYDKTYDNVGAFGWAFSDDEKYKPLKRPPQSWYRVQELEGE